MLSKMQTFELSADNKPTLFLLSPEDVASIFPEKNFQFWFVWPEQFSILPILSKIRPRKSSDVSGSLLFGFMEL